MVVGVFQLLLLLLSQENHIQLILWETIYLIVWSLLFRRNAWQSLLIEGE
jgi:hypothetical protein